MAPLVKTHFTINRLETMETVRDFIFLGSKITTGGDCSHEIKRHLLLSRKAMTKLDSKKRHGCTEQTFGLWEKPRVGCFKRTASKHVCYLG